MTYQIMNFVNPNRVRLIWQSSSSEVRRKFYVGDLIRSGESVSLFYRWYTEDWVLATQAGFYGHPAFSTNVAVHHQNVMDIMRRRLPPRNRTDFYTFLLNHGLANWREITDLALIGYSGARLPGDGFSFEIDFSIEQMPFEFFFDIAGFRYYSGMQLPMEALLQQPVLFRPEPGNADDPHAIEIVVGDWKIGYVPRTQAPWIKFWSQFAKLNAHIDRIEGPAARPLVYVYLSVSTVVAMQQKEATNALF